MLTCCGVDRRKFLSRIPRITKKLSSYVSVFNAVFIALRKLQEQQQQQPALPSIPAEGVTTQTVRYDHYHTHTHTHTRTHTYTHTHTACAGDREYSRRSSVIVIHSFCRRISRVSDSAINASAAQLGGKSVSIYLGRFHSIRRKPPHQPHTQRATGRLDQ